MLHLCSCHIGIKRILTYLWLCIKSKYWNLKKARPADQGQLILFTGLEADVAILVD